MTRGRSGVRGGDEGGGWRRQLMTRGRGVSCRGRSGSGSWSQRGGRVKVKAGAPQQQSTACQNERRTRSVGLEALGRF